jgi:hypothetical protein
MGRSCRSAIAVEGMSLSRVSLFSQGLRRAVGVSDARVRGSRSGFGPPVSWR